MSKERKTPAVLGLDMGGTHTDAVLLRGGTLLASVKVPTNHQDLLVSTREALHALFETGAAFPAPKWETADPGGRVPLYLDPGLTFGTGDHATTRLCLAALEREIRGGERVLDLGCGSGILSIAALKLGAASAAAADIDRMCLDVAYENAALNGVGRDVYDVRVGDVLSDESLRASLGGGYDVVLANIVADVIIGLAPLVRSFLREGGTFICSGIIDGRAEETADRLRGAGLSILETHQRKGWYAYLCR